MVTLQMTIDKVKLSQYSTGAPDIMLQLNITGAESEKLHKDPALRAELLRWLEEGKMVQVTLQAR